MEKVKIKIKTIDYEANVKTSDQFFIYGEIENLKIKKEPIVILDCDYLLEIIDIAQKTQCSPTIAIYKKSPAIILDNNPNGCKRFFAIAYIEKEKTKSLKEIIKLYQNDNKNIKR